MATKLQRKMLWHMLNHGGKALIFSGRKSTVWGGTVDGEAVIHGSMCLLCGLRANRWIENEPELGPAAYRITDKGKEAAGRTEPEMKAMYLKSHGPRWV